MSAHCGCCGQFYDVVEENFEGGWDALKVGFPLFVTTLIGTLPSPFSMSCLRNMMNITVKLARLILSMTNRWESHSSWWEWLDPSSWSFIRGRGTPQTGGDLLDKCCFLCFLLCIHVHVLVHVDFFSLHVR